MAHKKDHYPAAIDSLKKEDYMPLVKMGYAEDKFVDDASTFAIFTKKEKAHAKIIAKEAGIISGIDVAKACFKFVDRNLKLTTRVRDGHVVKNQKIVLNIEGNIQSILRAERVALNFLGMLSGISSKTNRLAKKLKPYGITLLDTRKTIPGFRILSKYAVTIGGGRNHRLSLSDMGMIKENHIAQAGGTKNALNAFRKKYPGRKIEIEIVSLAQLKKTLPFQPDLVLLDNMTANQLRACSTFIKEFNKKHKTHITSEASGGFNESNLHRLKNTGVDFVSMGALTHTIKPLDFSLLVTK